MLMEIEVEVKGSLTQGSSITTSVKKTFEKAVLIFICGPPKQEISSYEKLKEMIDYLTKHGTD